MRTLEDLIRGDTPRRSLADLVGGGSAPSPQQDEPVESGNIDLFNRPHVQNPDGSISTVRSASFNIDGKEVLLPTVSDDGKLLSNDEAVALYQKTGKHLGKFDSVEAADKYAEWLHNQQAALLVAQTGGAQSSSSSAATDDAGYDRSKFLQRTPDVPSDNTPGVTQVPVPQQYEPTGDESFRVPAKRTVDAEMRSSGREGTIDWIKGVGRAMNAENPTIAGKFAEMVYKTSLNKAVDRGTMTEEARDMVDREWEYNKEQLLRDVTEAQKTAANIAGGVADPVAIAAGAFGLSEAAGLARTLKLATAGGSYAGTYEALDQLVQDGRITSPWAIAAYTAGGALLPPGLDKGFRVAGKLLDKSALRSLERQTQQGISEGLNERAAFNRALVKMGMDRDTVSEYIDGTGTYSEYADTIGRWVAGINQSAKGAAKSLDNYVDFSKLNNGILTRAKNRFVGAMKYGRDTLDEFIEPISSSIRKISPEVLGGIRKFEYNTHKDSNTWRAQVQPAEEVYRTFSRKEKTIFKKAVRNQDFATAEAIYQKRGGADGVAAFRAVRPVLDDIFEQMRGTGVDINYLDNHWPMYLKNGEYDNFVKDMGWDPQSTWDRAVKARALAKGEKADVATEVARLEKLHNRQLTPDEIQHVKDEVKLWEKRKIDLTDKEKNDMLNSQLKGIDPKGLQTPKASRSRVIDKVTDDQLKYIEDPFVNLYSYIDHSAYTINQRKFFGKHLRDSQLSAPVVRFDDERLAAAAKAQYGYDPPTESTEDSIGAFVRKLEENGDITGHDIGKLTKLLNARFSYKPSGPIINKMKNVFYATRLGQLDSSVTQLSDLGTAAYVNGLRNTIHGLLRPKVDNALEEVQAQKVAQEFDSTASMSRSLMSWSLKYSAFKAIDRLGKKAYIEGSLNKALRSVNSAKNLQAFRSKWEPVFGSETDSLIGDLQRGEVTDNVKFMLFNELSDVQPITLLEVPKAYLTSPGGRAFYAMKTFTLKQIDLIRRDALAKITSGNPKEAAVGVGNMMRYMMIVGSMNHSTDQIKNIMQGRDVAWDDFQWTTLMKNFGYSPYLARAIEDANNKKQSPYAPILDTVFGSHPAYSIGETVFDATRDLGNAGRIMEELSYGEVPRSSELLKDLPPVGRILYNLYGGGVEKIMKQEREKMREELGLNDEYRKEAQEYRDEAR